MPPFALKQTGTAFFFSLLFLVLSSSVAFANKAEDEITPFAGVVEGVVKDASTGEALIGATVRVDGTALGAATTADGTFRIAQVPDGAQTLVVSYIGYKTERIAVNIQPGVTLEQEIMLSLDVLEGQEILVTAQAEGQIAAINEQLASNTIINVVSAARIQELPDVNAAESVGRLPGVSMVRSAGEGQKVVIRGLAPRYNTVTVNGRQLPGTSEDRSTDLSLVSSDLLAGIELTKAHTSDQDADYLGGSVNFKLADAPDGFKTDIRLQGGYNDQQSDLGQFKGNVSVSNRFLGNRLGVIVQANAENVNRGSDVFSASYDRQGEAEEGELAPLFIGGLNLTDRQEDRNRMGASLLLDYRLPNGKIKVTNFFSRLDRDVVTYNKNYAVSSRIIDYGIRDQDITTDLLSNEISGEYQIGPAFVEFGVGRAISNRDTPYDNRYGFSQRNGFITEGLTETEGPEVIPGFADEDLTDTSFSSGNFRQNRARERDLSASLDITIPYVIGKNIAGSFKTGGKLANKDRLNDEANFQIPFTFGPGAGFVVEEFPEIDFTFASQGFLGMERIVDTNYDAGDFLGGAYEFGFVPQLGFVQNAWDRLQDRYFRTSLGDFEDYENTEDIRAGYAMTEINIGRWFMVMPGIRYEQTEFEYTAAQGLVANSRQTDAIRTDTTVSDSYDHLLPMIHVRIKPVEWFDIRLARTETLSRPNHFDYSPREIVDNNGQRVSRGVPGLKPAESTNYDAFLSFKSNKLGLFTVGFFKKDIKGLIFRQNVPLLDPEEAGLPVDYRGFTLNEPVNNEGTTNVEGFEIDWQTSLSFLPKPFNGIVFNANFAQIDSETQYPRSLTVRNGFLLTRIDTFRVGNMINQAKNIANFSLGYDLSGFSGRISMLLQGESLNGIGSVPELDRFTGTYVRWDFSLKQQVTPRASVYFNANNFSDRPDEAFQVIEGFRTSQENYGWTLDLGVRYRY
ncbi:MAG: TonB-dependent receptor [Rhodothermales bacterium]